MKNNIKVLFSTIFIIKVIFFLIFSTACKREKPIETEVFGFKFLSQIPGLWSGPVTSETPAGNFDNWYVDFRPVSESQVSQFSLLDTNTVNNISFFIVKHNGKLKVAMRTEGCFNNQCCITYEVMDSVSEPTGYYRFSDFVKGTKRAYTEFIFNDSLVMKVYTNKFNTVTTLEPHSVWIAKLGSKSNITASVAHFNYPQPVMTRDFSDAFNNMAESIFYTFENDPYKSIDQPYVGAATVNISIDSSLPTDTGNKILLLFTTEPLFCCDVYTPENLKYISKSVLLSVATTSYQVKNVHPGNYYLYAFIDRNNDNQYLSGDYMNSNFSNMFTVTEKQNITVNTVIDFVIP